MGFSEGSMSNDSEWSLPIDHPIRDVRGGVASHMAEGDFNCVFLKQPMVA